MFSSEWDKHCARTYQENFGEAPQGDITQVDTRDIPDHDVLLAGFPCQPFSISGVSKFKALEREHGFTNLAQGTLFFDVARIIDEKRPQAFLLTYVFGRTGHTLQTGGRNHR